MTTRERKRSHVDELALRATSEPYDRFTFTWTIKEFTESSIGKQLSPVFVGGSTCQNSWQIIVDPKVKSKGKNDEEYIGIFLKLEKTKKESQSFVKAGYKFSIRNSEGNQVELHTAQTEFGLTRKLQVQGKSDMILTKELEKYVINDEFEISCTIWVLSEADATVLSSESTEDNGLAILSENFKTLLLEPYLSDFTIKTRTKEFKVHKVILAARCPAFKSKFNNGNGPIQDTLTCPNDNDELWSDIIKYIYTGELLIAEDRATDLLISADELSLAGLHHDCQRVIASGIGVENVISMLGMAQKYHAQYLRARAVEFFKSNKEAVKKTKAYKDAANTPIGPLLDLI